MTLRNEFGDFLLIECREAAAAIVEYAAAQQLYRELIRTPQFTQFEQQGLTLGYYRLGVAARRANDLVAARAAFQRCAELRDLHLQELESDARGKALAGEIRDAKINRMFVYARLGRTADVKKTADALLSNLPKLPAGSPLRTEWPINSAMAYAILAESAPDQTPAQQAEWKALAIAAVRTAIANGYTDKRFLETDPDLDAIRTEPAFREVVNSLK
jgi:hypothetical protein